MYLEWVWCARCARCKSCKMTNSNVRTRINPAIRLLFQVYKKMRKKKDVRQ